MGYFRAVRVGNVVEVAGTTAQDGEVITGGADVYAQTQRVLEKIGEALLAAGAALTDVVRTRIFVTDVSQWESVGWAHGEAFGENTAGNLHGENLGADWGAYVGRN